MNKYKKNTLFITWYRNDLERSLNRWADNLRPGSLGGEVKIYGDFCKVSINEYLSLYSILTGGMI